MVNSIPKVTIISNNSCHILYYRAIWCKDVEFTLAHPLLFSSFQTQTSECVAMENLISSSSNINMSEVSNYVHCAGLPLHLAKLAKYL